MAYSRRADLPAASTAQVAMESCQKIVGDGPGPRVSNHRLERTGLPAGLTVRQSKLLPQCVTLRAEVHDACGTSHRGSGTGPALVHRVLPRDPWCERSRQDKGCGPEELERRYHPDS